MFSTRNLIVVVVAIYLIMYVLKNNTHKMLVCGGVILFLCVNIEGLEDGESDGGFTDEKSDSGDAIVGNNTVSAGGARAGRRVKSKSINTGPYDGLCLKTGNSEYWMKSPDETSLVSNDNLYTYLSSQGPIKMKLSNVIFGSHFKIFFALV